MLAPRCVFVWFVAASISLGRQQNSPVARLDSDAVSSQENSAHTHLPRYLVLASKTVRSSSVYRVVVAILPQSHHSSSSSISSSSSTSDASIYPLRVRAAISRDGVEVTASHEIIDRGDLRTLLMKIPDNSEPGDYRLRVEADPHDSPGAGGSVFNNETSLLFSSRFLTILVQTSRALYNFGQMVRFRVVMLKTTLKPFDDPVTVFVLDPDGYIMRKWPSMSSNNGVISLKMRLPFIGKIGTWKIRVEARGQVTEKNFQIAKYFVPQWEVFVLTPTYFLLSEEAITGEVSAGFTNDRPVQGNATIELWVRPRLGSDDSREFKLVSVYRIARFFAAETFNIPMSSLQGTLDDLNNAEIKILARVTEYWYNETYVAWCNSKLVNSSISVRFLGGQPQVFKPGMRFYGQVLVTYHDSAPLTAQLLRKSSLTVRSSAGGEVVRIPSVNQHENKFNLYATNGSWTYTDYRTSSKSLDDSSSSSSSSPSTSLVIDTFMQHLADEHRWSEFRQTGLYSFSVDIPARDSPVELTATFETPGESGDAVRIGTWSASLRLLPFHSKSRRFLSVYSSNKVFNVGEYAVFHIKANFPITYFYTIVISKGLVMHGDKVTVDSFAATSSKTISVSISSEMPPSFRLVVYHVTEDGEVLTDSVIVPVQGFNNNPISIQLNQQKDHTKNTVELGMNSVPGATFCTSSNRAYLYSLQADNDITRTSVMAALHSFEGSYRGLNQALWRWRDGVKPIKTDYFTTPGQGGDTNTSFQMAKLVVFTDAIVGSSPDSDCLQGESRCLSIGCYNSTKRCDGEVDCTDGSDESQCESVLDMEEEESKFRLGRRSFFKDLFDKGDGDWAWTIQNIGYIGTELRYLDVPKTNEKWFISGFSVDQKYGFRLVENPLVYQSDRPFYMTLEMVSQVRRGETVIARLLLVNNQNVQVLALVTLKDSPLYQFVHVEEHGIVSHMYARTSSGDHQHLVPVAAGESFEVSFPIKPMLELGEFTVTVECSTFYSLDVESATVNVIMEGAPIGKHTSILLDLENKAQNYQFFKVFTDQDPTTGLEAARSFIYGSPQATISISGGVIGPIFTTVPMTTVNVFGRWLKSTDGTVFNFGYNIISLHYLRVTSQLTPSFLRKVLYDVSPFFIQIMKRFRRGPFLFYDGGHPSVWTTAWTIRQLQKSQFQDWDNYLYVEPRIMSEAAKWIALYQNDDGSFNETEWYHSPLDQKMKPIYKSGGFKRQQVPLTAHVLIALESVIKIVQGEKTVSNARVRAKNYLEKVVSGLKDPYEIAITAYALSVTNSAEQESAFDKLTSNSVIRRRGDMVYWARDTIEPNPIARETNTKPYIQAKNEQIWDAQAVEATSYALLVYSMRGQREGEQLKIVKWLNSMRMFDSAWISTVDSLLALEALTDYSDKRRLRSITNMYVQIDLNDRTDNTIVHIARNSSSRYRQVALKDVWGHVRLTGKGVGEAVVQMDLSFGIDQENLKDSPPKTAFDFDIQERFIQSVRNKSLVVIDASLRWISDESPDSGAAVLEVEFPSGYRIDQQVVNSLVVQNRRGRLPNLMSGKTAPDRVYWFFDRVYGNHTQKLTWTIHRRFLVANYTLYRSARLYEYFAPERFNMQLLKAAELNVIDVCQVCGSYQCPYCPWYSASSVASASVIVALLATLASIMARRFY